MITAVSRVNPIFASRRMTTRERMPLKKDQGAVTFSTISHNTQYSPFVRQKNRQRLAQSIDKITDPTIFNSQVEDPEILATSISNDQSEYFKTKIPFITDGE